jgi:Dyp-type peroxidase family
VEAGGAGTPDPENVQGNVAGFNKDHQRLVFIGFTDQVTARAFIAVIVDDVASCGEVRAFNALFKQVNGRRQGMPHNTVEASWLNIALTAAGLDMLGAQETAALPEAFRAGMRSRTEVIGDVGPSAPAEWIEPFKSETIHAVVILAADDPGDLNEEYEFLKARMGEHGVSELGGGPIDGSARPEGERGREHFGFKDGISQPGIEGLTTSSHEGTDQIAAGEFICGYPGVGDEAPPPPPASGYNPTPTPPVPTGLPEWTKDGSFLVFRRLRQDVGGFRRSLADQSGSAGQSPEQLGAKLVGRWPSGAPLEHTPGEPEGIDPAAADSSAIDPSVLSDERINNFDYDSDPDGHFVPRAAHIRKANPRSQAPPGKPESNRHRILRRGIAYGPEFAESEPAYPGTGPVPDTQDRGLLFLCYQASIERGFEFIQSQWVNQANFPQNEDGEDSIIAQRDEPRPFTLPRAEGDPVHLSFAQWVRTTGGEYFFAPSIAALKQLSQSS